MRRLITVIGAGSMLIGCAAVETAIGKFEDRAAPIVAAACKEFRAAEANPIVQRLVPIGAAAITGATGVPAGLIVASIKSYGDGFCNSGPPIGDQTSPEERAAWLKFEVTGKMIAAASRVLN